MKHVVPFLALTFVLCSFCLAADHPAKMQSEDYTAQELMQVSQEGFSAMRAVRSARVAIFNGEPEVANELLDKAMNELYAAKNSYPFFQHGKTDAWDKTGKGKTQTAQSWWIPIDGWVALAETFVASPEKKQHIDKANKYFKNGQSKEAIEELRLGEIDVTYTCVLLPWDATIKCVNQASKLADEHKYYEANLALKAAEDGLIMDSTYLIERPNPQTDEQYEQNTRHSDW